ncbi:MAG: hypothetical protein WED34_07355 [Planctomycetales bacterium]
MYHRWLTAGTVIVLLSSVARAGEEPRLADTTERLTADEEKAARLAVYDNGLTTASRDIRTRPYPRVLVVPKELEAVYEAKPQATARLLLKVVEGGRARDSIHAVCCIEALVASPEFGAITARGTDHDKWDDVIGGANPLTFREHSRQVCVKLIAEKEQDTAPKDEK